MSILNSGSSNNRFDRRTRIDDYYSDEESHYSPTIQQRKSTPVRKGTTSRANRSTAYRPVYYQDVSSEEEVDEEEVQRAMYELGLEDRRYFDSRRPQFPEDEVHAYHRNRFLPNSWMPPSYPILEEFPPRRSQHQPFLQRSESGRLPRWSNGFRPNRRAPEMYLPYDENSEEEDLGFQRRNSSASNPYRQRRSNSFSAPQSVRSQDTRSGYRSAHSVPASPLQTSDEESEVVSTNRRRMSLPRRGSDTPARPQVRASLGRSMSFQGYPAPNPNVPPPPPPPPPMMFPPIPHPMVERNHPLYNPAMGPPGDFYEERKPSPGTPGGGHHIPPMWPNFHSPPNPFPQPPMPMMPMFNPVMQNPNPTWNFLTPNQDVWPGAAEFPFPFIKEPEVKEEEAPEAKLAGPSEMRPPEMRPPEMRPPEMRLTEPRAPKRRGLSLFNGLFNRQRPDEAPLARLSAPLQASSNKKELKKAQEYEKLGTFWCWRVIPPQETNQAPSHFESFSVANQKLINRKVAKGQSSNIFLGKEKKLPGVIMIDVSQGRGCCMANEGHFLQLELKKEQYNGNADGNTYVVHNSSTPGW